MRRRHPRREPEFECDRASGGDDIALPGARDEDGRPRAPWHGHRKHAARRSEEHTSELQSLMRTSYAVFCLNKKNPHKNTTKSKTPNTTNATRKTNRNRNDTHK